MKLRSFSSQLGPFAGRVWTVTMTVMVYRDTVWVTTFDTEDRGIRRGVVDYDELCGMPSDHMRLF